MKTFVHLHLHSEYSLSDSTVRLKPLAAKIKEHGMLALALTDWSNLYGVVKFFRTFLAAGIKPIIGCDIWVENPINSEYADRVVLLCMNIQGFRGLNKLLSNAYLRGQRKGKVVISWQDLSNYNDHLIVIMDAWHGIVANHINVDVADIGALESYHQLFTNRLYLEICRVGRPGEQAVIELSAQLARQYNVGLVATNRVQFLQEDEFDTHEIRVCIHSGRTLNDSRRPREFTSAQYLRSAQEMHQLFADFPEAISNTVEIAQRCNVFLEFDRNFLPEYPDVSGQPIEVLLRHNAEKGLCQRLGVNNLQNSTGANQVDPQYLSRLNLELDTINRMGFPGYFLIVADFIRWAREQNIPVGPGRGSGAGSLVAWAIGITELDPLQYGLLFERFLNPERVSLPDFDIDFCMEGRDRVINYVVNRYGQEQVSQIITFGTMAAKAVIRDVGRVMDLPYGFVDQIAKLIPFTLGITLDKALEQEEPLQQRYQGEPEVAELIDNARLLEGLTRNIGKHAGGVVIAPQPLTEYTPLYFDNHLNQTITHLDKDDLEAIGLVKFDFLGLRTLTIIDWAVKMVNQQRQLTEQTLFDIMALKLDDIETYKLIQQGQTTAIFQLESRGMKELIFRLKPEHFTDLIALVALFRPGPLQSGMVEDFINRKHGHESIRYPHPDLESILEQTYGVILYQEQVMQIAQTLSSYSLGSADLLRQAMGKKKTEEMAEQRTLFVNGALERGIKQSVAESIFNLIEKFAGYGFNKSHSAAYALLSYQTAWLKTHYPAAFMAATLCADLDNTDRVVVLLSECTNLELTVSAPNINQCGYGFQPISENEILYGMGAIKGVGRAVVEAIVVERERGGCYQDLFEFCHRLDNEYINKRALEALIKSGAMDDLGAHRAALLAEIPITLQAARQSQKMAQAGQLDLFGTLAVVDVEKSTDQVAKWSREQRLNAEKETLGLYLTGHPFDQCSDEFVAIVDSDLKSMGLEKPKKGAFAGLVIAIRVINTRRGKMAFIMLDNAVERLEVSIFSKILAQYQEVLQKDRILLVQGELSIDEFSGNCQMRAEKIYTIETMRTDYLRCLEIQLTENQLSNTFFGDLQNLLSKSLGGMTFIVIQYRRNNGEMGTLKLGQVWRIHVDKSLLIALQQQIGDDNITFHYARQKLRSGADTATKSSDYGQTATTG